MSVEGADKIIANIGRVLNGTVRQMTNLMTRESREMQSFVREHHLTGGTTAFSLAVRSGRLRASCIPIPTTVTENAVEGGISFGTRYARIHIGPRGQQTVIRPKTAQYLAVPLPAAKTGAGVARGAPRSGVFGETFIAKSKAGNLIIFGKLTYQRGKKAGQVKGSIMPLFVLKKQVTVPARVHPEDIFNYMRPKIMQDAMMEGIKID